MLGKALVLLALSLAVAAPAASARDLNGVTGAAQVAGPHLVDGHGRTLAFRGFVLPQKVPPYLVTAAGFSADDADLLAREGFNLLQLRFTYGAVEPQPGVYDEAYIAEVVRTVELLTARGIRVLLQVNQGNYGPVTHGQGFPAWATFTDGLDNPDLGFGPNFLGNPALLRAWDGLWADRATARGEGIQAGLFRGAAEVMRRLAGNDLVLGLDLLNEPWMGSRWPECYDPTDVTGHGKADGCRAFDRDVLEPFWDRYIAALRPAAPGKVLFYEPVPTFDHGIPTYLRDVGKGDPQVAFSFHAYCTKDGGGANLNAATPSPAKDAECRKQEGVVFDNAAAHAKAERVPLLSSEFGATPLAASTRRLLEQHEERGLSWNYAAYCCRDPKRGTSGDVILDPTRPPTAKNLDQEKLRHLARPYAAALTGVQRSARFDPERGRYVLRYTTAKPGGGRWPATLDSVVHVPARHFGTGYEVRVRGAAVTSPTGARQLLLRTARGAREVRVEVRRARRTRTCGDEVTLAAPAVPSTARGVRVFATVDGRETRVRRVDGRRVVVVHRGGRARRDVRIAAHWTARGEQVRRLTTAVVSAC